MSGIEEQKPAVLVKLTGPQMLGIFIAILLFAAWLPLGDYMVRGQAYGVPISKYVYLWAAYSLRLLIVGCVLLLINNAFLRRNVRKQLEVERRVI